MTIHNHAQGAAPGCPLCWVLRVDYTLRWWFRESWRVLGALFCAHHHTRVVIEGRWLWYECIDCLGTSDPIYYPTRVRYSAPDPEDDALDDTRVDTCSLGRRRG